MQVPCYFPADMCAHRKSERDVTPVFANGLAVIIEATDAPAKAASPGPRPRRSALQIKRKRREHTITLIGVVSRGSCVKISGSGKNHRLDLNLNHIGARPIDMSRTNGGRRSPVAPQHEVESNPLHVLAGVALTTK